MNTPVLLRISALLLASAVALGAFGAHALEEVLTAERMKTWETAVFYHTWNTLGVMLIAIVQQQFNKVFKTATTLLLFGVLIFSGSLYTLCLSGIGIFGAITPIGGVLLISGWIVFGVQVVSSKQSSTN
ncbi:MAG: DUF423 domain-containing protein [Balneolaceae bacterium]|nr:DUF423 domain-containing protein [Balneolaceae bacterium]